MAQKRDLNYRSHLIVIVIVATLTSLELCNAAQHSLTQSNIHKSSSSTSNQHSDAPKYYHLNALLYKTKDSSDRSLQESPISPQEAALELSQKRTGGASDSATEREGSSGIDGDGSNSSIDSLIRAMRRRQMGSETDNRDSSNGGDVASADDDDYPRANVGGSRRKAFAPTTRTDVEPNDAAEDVQRSNEPIPNGTSSAARLRSRNAAPRRKRRASMKQTLPKLRPGMKMRGRGFIVKAKRRRA